jgi:isopenicillin-N epimerase
MAANRALAIRARDVLTQRLNLPKPAPDEMLGSMAAVPLPAARPGLAGRLREQGIVAVVSPWPAAGHSVLRVSAQRYNTLDEYSRLADVIAAD